MKPWIIHPVIYTNIASVHKPSTHNHVLQHFFHKYMYYYVYIEDIVMACQEVLNVATRKVLALKDPLDFH